MIGLSGDAKARIEALEDRLDRIVQLLETLLAAELHNQGLTKAEIVDLIER